MDENMNANIKDAINKFKENKTEAKSYNIPENNEKEASPTYSNYHETDPDLIVGYELVELPSKSINNYGGVGFDEFKVEYLTSKDEDVLTTPSLIKNGTVLDVLLKRKIKHNINLDELYYGDKNALILFLRTSSYGYNYDVEVYNPRTDEVYKDVVDLSKLKYKKITRKPDADGLYSFELKKRKKIIRYKLLTSGEEKRLLEKADAIKEAYNSEVSEYNSLKLKNHIISIDGNTSRDYINKFVDAMPLMDTYELRKDILDVTPDVDMEYEFKDKEGFKFKSRISIGVDFFFPNI
jgi:hypothetical protein